MFDYGLVSLVVTMALSVTSVVFCSQYFKVKGKLGVLADLIATTSKAMEDKDLTQEELTHIISLIQQLMEK